VGGGGRYVGGYGAGRRGGGPEMGVRRAGGVCIYIHTYHVIYIYIYLSIYIFIY
jgi:hypothetical protein